MGVRSDEVGESANINRAPDIETTPVPKSERMDIPEQETATGTDGVSPQRFNPESMVRNAELGNLERLQEAQRVLERPLSPQEQQGLITAHEY